MNNVSVEDYKKKINNLNNRFFLILENYKKTYPMFKLNPTYDQYSTSMATSQGNLTALQHKLFMTKNSLEKNIVKNNNNIVETDKTINKLIGENKKLTGNVGDLRDSAQSAKGLISEERKIYNLELLKLTTLIVGMAAMGGIIYKTKH
jgi:hypothetical protein